MSQAKRRKGYGAKLDDLDLLLAVAPERDVQVQTIPPEATRIDTGQSPEDFVSEFGQTFSRAQFAGGEGLGFAHREGSASDRYWDSRRIDVSLPNPGDRHAARLSHEVADISDDDDFGTSDMTKNPIPKYDGRSIHIIRRDQSGADELWHTNDPVADDPSWIGGSSSGGELYSHVFVGSNHYVAGGADGIFEASDLTSAWSSLETDQLWAVKGRVLARGSNANSGNELYEARSGADSVLVSTAPPVQDWMDVADGGSHVLAAAEDGYIYAFAANDTGDLELEAQTPIPFETPQFLTHIGGVVLVLTTKKFGNNNASTRLWRSDIDDNGTLQNMDLIREWSDPGEFYNPRSITRDGENVYIGLVKGNTPSVWRYSLRTGGISHFLDGMLVDLFSLGDRLFGLASEVRREEDTYESSGYLITPAADFFTSLDKSWLRITVDADTPGDSSVVVSYATDLDAMDDPNSSLWTQVGTVDSNTTDDELTLTDAQSRFIVLKVDFNATTDQTDTPRLFSVSVTSNVIGEEVSITLPVNVSDRHERFGRRPVRRKVGTGKTMFQNLLDKRGKSVDLELYRHGLTVRGIVQEIQTPTQSITPRGSPTVYSLVTFRGTIVSKS